MLVTKQSPVAIDFHSLKKSTLKVSDYQKLLNYQHLPITNFDVFVLMFENFVRNFERTLAEC